MKLMSTLKRSYTKSYLLKSQGNSALAFRDQLYDINNIVHTLTKKNYENNRKKLTR